jgi:C4-dicarboxylate-specific signal transduction histidine kinase
MKYRIALIAFLLLIVSVIVTLNYYFDRNYQAEMADQINNQQLILAKTLSMTIENTLDHFMEEIVSLGRLLSRRGLESRGLDEFVRHAFEELNEEIRVDILVIDADKKVLFTSIDEYVFTDEDNEICGMCNSLNRGKYYIEPSTEDRSKIKAITPILKGEEQIGAIMIFVNIDDLNRQFIMPVKTGPKGNAWIMDAEGTLMYHPTMPEMVGRNIRNHKGECFECHSSFKAEMDILNSQDVGFSSYVAPYGEDKLIAFSRIDSVGWIVCLSIPFSEVTKSIKKSMRMHSMLVLSIMFSTVFVAFFIIIINRARAKAEAKASYADKVREYADELESIVTERTGELRSPERQGYIPGRYIPEHDL